MFQELVGRFLLWNWRRGLKAYRFVDAPPMPRALIEEPEGLLGVWDLGRGRDPRFTVVFEDRELETYFVLRLSPLPDAPGGISIWERVPKLLLNVYEPNGAVGFETLPTGMRRHVVQVVESYRTNKTRETK